MKDIIPEPVHESYRRHRKQRTSQIILPMALTALLFIAMIVWISIATANGGDVGRWAAISTMWISIPVCLMGFIFLALLGGLIYLMGRLLGVAPVYTGKAQDFVHKLAIRIRRAADTTVKPVFAVNGFGATIKALLGRK
jgi:energy-coupling factor transporter transmembrane protein EcfT